MSLSRHDLLAMDLNDLELLHEACGDMIKWRRSQLRWSLAEQARLTDLWLHTRLPMSEIARQMGYSRSKIAGRLNDAGLFGKARGLPRERVA